MEVAEMTRKESLVSDYWEFYKEVWNVKPRWINFEGLTEDDLEQMLAVLAESAKGVWAMREAEEKEAIARFEKSVANTIANGAADRATAIKWLQDAEGGNDDIEFFEYLQGIPYGYVAKTAV
jgi:hypothetical protein